MRRSQDNSLLLIAYAIENQRTVTGLRVGKGVGLGVGDWLGLDEGWRRRRVLNKSISERMISTEITS